SPDNKGLNRADEPRENRSRPSKRIIGEDMATCQQLCEQFPLRRSAPLANFLLGGAAFRVLQFGSFQPLHTAAEQDQLADGADASVESANDRVAAFELSPRGRQTPKILLQILRLVVVFSGMDHPSIHHLSKESRRK